VTDWYRVTRDVPAADPNNHYGADVAKDTIWPEYRGPLYGCCDLDNGIALEDQHGAAFEFPRDAVERLVLSGEGADSLARRFGKPTRFDLADTAPISEVPF
jgi:hypothetical protein